MSCFNSETILILLQFVVKINDFELGFGDFQNVNDNTALLKWKIGQPTSVSIDHTTLTNQGSFAYVDFQSNILNSKGRLETPKFQFNGYECIQFWYLLNGKDNGNLNIYVKYINDYGLPIWSKNSHNNDEWRFGQITVGNNSNLVYNYSVIFEAVKGINNDGIAGIDDVNIKVGDCPAPINCNFEDFSLVSGNVTSERPSVKTLHKDTPSTTSSRRFFSSFFALCKLPSPL